MVEPVIANRYQLGRPLGAGGMARVVAARDLRLDRPVAVKLVPVAGIDRAGRERFVREARSAAGFSHPDAVAVYDAGESDGYLFLVMELVDGSSLAERLAERGRLDVDEALRITHRVLAALGAAHEAGIVHRDVKPGNVLLGPAGEVKLADFGIAKRLGDIAADVTSSGQFVGTPKYLAPEQVVGERSTPATDVYAVGVVLYEMLAGRPPYDAGNPMATAIAHRDAPIPDLHRARPDVPAHVVSVVRRAMAKRPAERFGSAAEMAAALVQPPATIRPARDAGAGTGWASGPPPPRKPDPTAGHGRAAVPTPEGVVVGGGRGCRRRWRCRPRRRPARRPAGRLGRPARHRVAGDDHRRPDHDRRPDDDARADDDAVAPTTTLASDDAATDGAAVARHDRGAHRLARGGPRPVRSAGARLPGRAPRDRGGERPEAG